MNYIILGLQLVGLILAVDIGGWFAIIYIGINLAWAGWWCYNNWDLLENASDVILTSVKKKAYYKGKIVKEKKKKK